MPRYDETDISSNMTYDGVYTSYDVTETDHGAAVDLCEFCVGEANCVPKLLYLFELRHASC